MRIESDTKQRSRRSRAFTLIEVIVTLSMVGGIMAIIYTVLYSTLDAKRLAELHVARSYIGPLLLDQVEQDIRQIFAFNLNHGQVFLGEDERISGQDADEFRIIAMTPSTSARVDRSKAVFSPVNEIGYTLTENPDNRDFMILWRREDFFVDEEPLRGGKGTALYRRVTGFDIKYYDELGEDATEEDSWDMETRDGNFPAAVLVSLTIEIEPRTSSDTLRGEELDRRRVTFKRYITFPADIARQVAVLPSIPLAELPGETGGAAGRGGKDKGGGDDDNGNGNGFNNGSGGGGLGPNGGGGTSVGSGPMGG